MKTKVLLATLALFVMYGCAEKDLGDYVYEDYYKVLHTDKECLKKNYLNIGNENLDRLSSKGVKFIPTKDLPNYRKERGELCPNCVTDHQTDQIRDIYKKYHESRWK